MTVAVYGVIAGTYSVRAQQPRTTDDRLVIQRRRIVLRRPVRIAKQFPDRKTAVVVFPVVSGLADPAVLRKVRSAISFKNIFDYSLEEYREDSWLTEFGYTVNYNKNYIFDITFSQSGMGAYPDDQQKHFLINLRDGSVVKAVDVFDPAKLSVLAKLVDAALQREIKRLAKENADSKDSDADQKESIDGAYEGLKFEEQNLNDFSVGPTGITFLYDAGFPHVIKALEPVGRYFYTYASLREYIRPDGILGRFRH